MFECLEECGANTDCSSSCYRASVVCNDACPCHAGNLFDFKNSEATTLFSDCPFGCKQCKNPICKSQLALILYNYIGLANIKFKPMLYDFQGNLSMSCWNCFTCKTPILGQNINFDFEVDKNALVVYYSCGAWLNGEYYIVTPQDLNENGPIIRTVKNWVRVLME